MAKTSTLAVLCWAVWCVMACVQGAYLTGGGPAVKQQSVQHIGNQTDPHLATEGKYPNRDGGAVGKLGGLIVWFWSDTQGFKYPNGTGTWYGFWGNSAAVAHAGAPLDVQGPLAQGIPFTELEASFNKNHSNVPRVVLWPKSGVVEVAPGSGLLFVPKDYFGNSVSGEINKGIVVSKVVIGADGNPAVTRLGDTPLFANHAPLYGNLAAATDDEYVYLWSGSNNVFVARALLAQAHLATGYTYWYADAKAWKAEAPLSNDTKAAIMNYYMGYDGNIYYSAYHKAWLMIFTYHADAKVYVRSALAPEGPFVNETLLYTSPRPTNPKVGYIYGTVGTNLYDATGKSAIVDYTWCTPTGYVNWVLEVKWE